MTDSVCGRKLEEMEDLDENLIATDPWSQMLLATILKVTKKGVLNWLCVLRKIYDTDMKSNNEYGHLFIDSITNLYEELILDMDIIREKFVDKLIRAMELLENVCKDLQIPIPEIDHQHKPLAKLLDELEMNIAKFKDLLKDRLKIIEDLNNRAKELCNEFGRKPNLLPEQSPLPTNEQVENYKHYLKRLELEKQERICKLDRLHNEILQYANDLDYEGRTNFERVILSMPINNKDYNFLLKDKEFDKLEDFHRELLDLMQQTKDEIGNLRQTIEKLWNILEYDPFERDNFLTINNKLTSLQTLQNYRSELNRCESLKKENIKKFVQEQRKQLQELWTKCCLTDEQQRLFKYFHSDCFTEDLFDLHECEIRKWQRYYNDNKTILSKLEEYRKLWQEFCDLQMKCDNNKDRYKNRGGQLLTEEKLRNKLTKKMTKLEQDLHQLHNDYKSTNNGCVFMIFGEEIPKYLNSLHVDLEQQCKNKLSARKLEREKSNTLLPTKSRMNLFPSTNNLLSPSPVKQYLRVPPGSAKRKLMATPRMGGGDGSVKKLKSSPKNANKMPKLNVSHKRRSLKQFRSAKKTKPTSATPGGSHNSDKENINDTASTNYGAFEKDISNKHTTYRSTGVGLKSTN